MHFCKLLNSRLIQRNFSFKKVKNTVTWPYVVNDLSGDEIVRTFDEKNSKKEIKKSLELKK